MIWPTEIMNLVAASKNPGAGKSEGGVPQAERPARARPGWEEIILCWGGYKKSIWGIKAECLLMEDRKRKQCQLGENLGFQIMILN